ncbi:MAG: shikimate kinase [Pseudomonadales bacterium]|jgi:shikimate kinase
MMRQNIVLIGMPGAGKSTVGVLLAKELGLNFIDTDVLIQVRQQQTLQDLLDAKGYLALRAAEEEVLLSLFDGSTEYNGVVVATGGSAVYSEVGMKNLAANATIVYLDVPLVELRYRVKNYDERGIAHRPEQTFENLFTERNTLYTQYAQLTVDAFSCGTEDVVTTVIGQMSHLR